MAISKGVKAFFYSLGAFLFAVGIKFLMLASVGDVVVGIILVMAGVIDIFLFIELPSIASPPKELVDVKNKVISIEASLNKYAGTLDKLEPFLESFVGKEAGDLAKDINKAVEKPKTDEKATTDNTGKKTS